MDPRPRPQPCGACGVLLWRPNEGCEHWPAGQDPDELAARLNEQYAKRKARERARADARAAVAKFRGEMHV